MKRNLLLTLLLAAVALATAAFSRPVVQGHDEPDTKLGHYMEDINKTLRKLRTTLRDPAQNAQSLEMVRSVELWVVQAKNEQPAKTEEIPEAERAQFVTDFGHQMCDLLRKTIDLEEALLDGQNDKAQELRNEINKLKSPAHKKFKKRDEHDDEHGSERERDGDGATPHGQK